MHRLACAITLAAARLAAADPPPLAASIVADAHAAALRRECKLVEMYAYQLRALDPDAYRARFVTDPAIVACDPRAPLAVARALADAAVADHATGFALELDYGLERTATFTPPAFDAPTDELSTTFGTAPVMRMFAAAQLDTLAIGGTLAFQRVSSGTDATTVLRIGPAIEVQLWRSRGARVEAVFAGDATYGHLWNPQPSDSNASLVGGRAGVGLRYWLTPSFAIGATARLQLERTSPTSSAQSGTTALALDNALAIVGVL